ncbi:MAG: glycosyltransferase [Candidatus Daviesbacteria bacterium]|nr:glycosyltransferase [Candidatus Daviesbacteria bacterium]
MNTQVNHKLLSVIVPAFKQEKVIKRDLENIDDVLHEGLQDLNYEIICVVDGKADNTYEEALKVKSSNVRVVGYDNNRGKGYAVRFGMVRSKGDLVSFLDAGMDISPKGITMLMAHMNWYNADIIVGSKRHPVSMVNYPPLRHLLSIGYHLGVKLLFGLPLTDTQSGIKIFKRDVLEKVLPRLLVKRYAMDIEMLAVAKYLGFERIYEAPIEVTFDRNTSQISWTTVFKMAWDTMAVFYRLKVLHFYDDSNQKSWRVDPELQFQKT